jgi:transcriptional regulator with XRE-family HTH domain
VRRTLNLTLEEFARPLPIEDGESLITRLETGFSRASAEIVQLICDAWGISKSYLLAGQGEMFEAKGDYCSVLTTLLKTYLSVATFDRKGQQYWKGCLVDDLRRLIDVGKLNGREMCRVVRTLYDYLDVEQFGELLERMGK